MAEDAQASFWDQRRKGANCQSRKVGPDHGRAAAASGIGFVRLLPDAWPAARHDLLLGSADAFEAIDQRDLAPLVKTLDEVDRAGVKVVLVRWAHQHRIPARRIMASEFGVDRRVGGAERNLRDLLPILNENGGHWAFYAFRQDGEWTGLDYELGPERIGPPIGGAESRAEDPERHKERRHNPLWQILRRGLAPGGPPG